MSEPVIRDPARHEALARAALLETTTVDTVGELIGEEVREDGVVDVRFAAARDAYRGWTWVVSVAEVDDGGEPTVLELGLLPGEDALVAPDWVPWSVRLAEWEAHQAELAAAGEAGDAEPVDEADVDDEDDVDDLDDDDLDDVDDDLEDEDDEEPDDFVDDVDDEEPGIRSTHSGDLDGIDIDSLDIDSLDPDSLDPDAV